MSLAGALDLVETSSPPARGAAPFLPREFVRRYEAAAFAGLVVLLIGLAWANRFVQDDAFIAFRYSQHPAEGRGPVFNVGERVEGYTSALWVALTAGAIRLGMDPVAASCALGLAAFAGSLVLTRRLAGLLGLGPAGAWAAVVALGTNYSFCAYATSGLETQLQACLATAAAVLLARAEGGGRWSAHQLLGFSAVATAALLTRLDSVLLMVPAGVLALWSALTSEPGARAKRLAALVGVPAVVLGAWFAWKPAYYGSVLPNTFHAEVGGAAPLGLGTNYFVLFLVSYGLLPLVVLAAAVPWPERRRRLALWGGLALWAAYVIGVGGDFMEFRFWMPVLPVLLVLVVGAVWAVGERPAWRAALPVALGLGSVRYYVAAGERTGGVLQIRTLKKLVEVWGAAGHALQQAFPDEGVRIAVAAAGALPYYARLETVDMFGLTDPWVARYGSIAMERAGHRRLAPMAYLLRREAHLFVGHPVVAPANRPPYSRESWMKDMGRDDGPWPPGLRFIEILIGRGRKLVVVQLRPSAEVERAAQRLGWKTYPVVSSLALSG